jgi:predicted phosphoribosyltransferase
MLPQAIQDLAREAVRYVAAKPVSLSALATLLVALGVATGAATAFALRRD